MGVVITIALSNKEVDMIREIREVSSLNVQDYQKKGMPDEMTQEELGEYSNLLFKEVLFSKMEGLIENEIVKETIREGQQGAKVLAEAIKEVNVKAEISTHEDIERFLKLYNELLQTLRKSEKKQETNFDSEFVSLSGKEMKKLVNEWIAYHAKNDEKLSPGYFKMLLHGWENIYKRQSGMSILSTF
ncbi:hypothetical protein IMSAGC011_02202 [Lachnospiraceae bacterium]|nr:hypothetical protein IMSAGC011_02202 [Lachnospiraceae bacterium]